jgi:pimeloyl-ACP methyl ester carboxylesterase
LDTLLLLPGLDGTGRLFAALLPELEQHFLLRPVAYPRDRVLGVDALAEHARGFVPPASRYAIVAESFSGLVALELAREPPPGLTAIVLVAAFVRSPFPWFLRAPLRAGAEILVRLPAPRWPLARWLTGGDATLAADVRTAIASVRPTVVAERLRMLTRVDARRDLALCRAPMLYLAGQKDRLVTRSHTQELTSLRPDITVRELPAPHLVLQTQPKRAAAEILQFVSGQGKVAGTSREGAGATAD